MNAIRAQRIAQDMSQAELAQEVGCKRSTIAMYESGKITPSSKKLKRLSIVLKISADKLLADISEEDTQITAIVHGIQPLEE